METEPLLGLDQGELFLLIMCMGISAGTFLKPDTPHLFQKDFIALLAKLGKAYEKSGAA